jgi:hypothetical protein
VTGSERELYGFELEPEVRDWLDSLSDSDYKRVDEVGRLLTERAPNSAARGQTTWKDRSGSNGCGFGMLRPA